MHNAEKKDSQDLPDNGPSVTLEHMYSGERILPGSLFNVTFQQSKKAYQLVASMAANKTVVDVACGEGYGTALIAQQARLVCGVDKDADAIATATRKYRTPTTSFLQADIFELPQKLSQKFDIVCCFQTIEHITNQDAFLETLKALTAPGGLVIVSTPNRRMFPSFNPYHVRELDYSELKELFTQHFSRVEIRGVHGSSAVMQYRTTKDSVGRALLRLDALNFRHHLPRRLIQLLYSFMSYFVVKRLSWWRHRRATSAITSDDFTVSAENLEQALDFIAIAQV